MTQKNALIIRQWNGRTIRQRDDGYLSATDMCQACGKLWSGWYRLDSAKEYLKALENRRYADLHNGKLIDIIQGGIPEDQGTWVYRKVALRLAQWLSPEFAVQVDEWTEELMTNGKVELQPQPQSAAEMFLMVAQQMVEQERRTKELEAKLALIEAAQQQAIASLDQTVEPEVEAEELSTRAKLNRLVRDYSAANAVHFHEVWRRVYREFRDRYHVDLRQRAKNIQTHGGKRFTSLDVCEQLGKIEELYAVAFELLKA